MGQLIKWIKNNRLAAFLILLLTVIALPTIGNAFLRSTSKFSSTYIRQGTATTDSFAIGESKMAMDMAAPALGIMPPSYPEAPPVNSPSRMVVQNSYLSLLVTNIVDTKNTILQYVTQQGGYMVSASVSNPQEAGTATVSIRIPSANLDGALAFFREQAIKVVSEELQGQDVTDEFVDIDTRILQLEQSKEKMNQLLDRATEVSDIMNINNQIINIQSQIDSLKGRQLALTQNADLTKVTLYLSTDELSLPYAPTDPFRPDVIFKLAVRSLLTHVQKLASSLIWLAVYGVVVIPLIITTYLIFRKLSKK